MQSWGAILTERPRHLALTDRCVNPVLVEEPRRQRGHRGREVAKGASTSPRAAA